MQMLAVELSYLRCQELVLRGVGEASKAASQKDDDRAGMTIEAGCSMSLRFTPAAYQM